MFSLPQLQFMIQQIVADISIDHAVKTQVIRALQNRIAEFYLNTYLGNTLNTEVPAELIETTESIDKKLGS